MTHTSTQSERDKAALVSCPPRQPLSPDLHSRPFLLCHLPFSKLYIKNFIVRSSQFARPYLIPLVSLDLLQHGLFHKHTGIEVIAAAQAQSLREDSSDRFGTAAPHHPNQQYPVQGSPDALALQASASLHPGLAKYRERR